MSSHGWIAVAVLDPVDVPAFAFEPVVVPGAGRSCEIVDRWPPQSRLRERADLLLEELQYVAEPFTEVQLFDVKVL